MENIIANNSNYSGLLSPTELISLILISHNAHINKDEANASGQSGKKNIVSFSLKDEEKIAW